MNKIILIFLHCIRSHGDGHHQSFNVLPSNELIIMIIFCKGLAADDGNDSWSKCLCTLTKQRRTYPTNSTNRGKDKEFQINANGVLDVLGKPQQTLENSQFTSVNCEAPRSWNVGTQRTTSNDFDKGQDARKPQRIALGRRQDS